MADAEPLTLEELVTLEQDVEPYIMEWPVHPGEDGEPEAAVLVVSKRPGDFWPQFLLVFFPKRCWPTAVQIPHLDLWVPPPSSECLA